MQIRPLAAAQTAIDQLIRQRPPAGPEAVETAAALGRVLARDVAAPLALPPAARAAVDGFALRAEDSVGASAYNPATLMLQMPDMACLPGTALPITAGWPLPAGADAVLPLHLAQLAGGVLEVLSNLAAGDGVERPGQDVAAGAVVLEAGRRLRSMDLALAAALGLPSLPVRPRPRVRLISASRHLAAAGPAALPDSVDAAGLLFPGLIARDGGVLERHVRPAAPGQPVDLRAALTDPGADLILVCGGASPGSLDRSAILLAEVGALDWQGVALRPGELAGAGHVDGVPVLLLPGSPAAGLTAYELLAGRAVRRLTGLDPALPHRLLVRPLGGRKLTSEIGVVELVPVRLAGPSVLPLPLGFGLGALVQADGFVLVPAAAEGYAPGTPVEVHLFDAAGG